MKICVVGATGLCGVELLKLLESSDFEIDLECFASEKSIGIPINFRNQTLKVKALSSKSFINSDFIFFAAGSKVSKKWIKQALSSQARIIDLSSAFRKDSSSLLIIPEINGHLLSGAEKLISSPNCTTTMLLVALYPLHKLYGLKSVIVSTYQAASGGGHDLLNKLLLETKNYLEKDSFEPEYAFNTYPHPEPSSNPNLSLEEEKMIFESKKILNDDSIEIFPTCIRVPTLRSHCLSVHATFKNPLEIEQCINSLCQEKSIKVSKNVTATNSQGMPYVFCSKIRQVKNDTLEMWISSDQLLKGAALNAFQIFQHANLAFTSSL